MAKAQVRLTLILPYEFDVDEPSDDTRLDGKEKRLALIKMISYIGRMEDNGTGFLKRQVLLALKDFEWDDFEFFDYTEWDE